MLNDIWLLLDSRSAGGIETHVLQLALGLRAHGQSVCVVFLKDHGPHPLKAHLSAHGLNYKSLDGKLLSLINSVRKAQPQVIHTHGYKAGIMGRIAARLCVTRVVSTFHAGESSQGRLAIYDWLDRHLAWLSHTNFAVSDLIADKVPACLQVLNNFIDTTDITGSEGSQIAFVGRLSSEKAPDRFIALARHFPQQAFHIYGDGPMAQALQSEAPKNVIFHGQQADMNSVWRRVGLLVMPSRYEGLPLAALEAMGRQIPILATKAGDLPKLIDHNINGWIIAQEDPKGLHALLLKWLNCDKKRRKTMGEAARRKVDSQYASSAVVPRILEYY